MWKLHRYYLKELTIASGITFLVLFSIALLSLVARGLQRTQGSTELLDAALATLYLAMDAFPHLLTIAFLLATVLTYGRATQDREMVAVAAAGVSPRTPLVPAVMFGTALAIVGSLCLHFVLPEIHFRKYRIVRDVMRNWFLNMKIGTDRIPILETGITLTFGSRDPVTQDFHDCLLFLPHDGSFGQFTGSFVHVQRVSMPPPPNDDTVLTIELHGIRDPFGMRLDDSRLVYDVRTVSEKARRTENNEDITSDQLLAEVLRGVHDDPAGAEFTMHRRACFALMPLLMAPIGYCLSLFAGARGRVVAIAMSLLPLVLFYAGDLVANKVMRISQEPLAAWLPAGLLALIGGPFCARMLRR